MAFGVLVGVIGVLVAVGGITGVKGTDIFFEQLMTITMLRIPAIAKMDLNDLRIFTDILQEMR